MGHDAWVRLVIIVLLTALSAALLTLCAPLRQTSGDTVPGRIGAALLQCGGGFDFERVNWVRSWSEHDKYPYFLRRDAAGEVSSVFGPAPAVMGAIALADFGDDNWIDDDTLRRRERYVSAFLLAVATGLLTLAAAARARLSIAAGAGLVAASSFAGAATLGQGLWQATVALPALIGAVVTLAWRDKRPWLGWFTPALLVLAVQIRPTIAALALGLGLVWLAGTRTNWRIWGLASAIALVAAVPIVTWNMIHLDSLLPLGQWHANTRMTDEVFVTSMGNFGYALLGLLVSPGRGLVWFAPLVLVAVVQALRARSAWSFAAGGVVLQIVMMALFFKWFGGLAYGPRLLAEATWVAVFLLVATSVTWTRLTRVLAITSVVVTVVVGQLGLWRFRAEQWETRRMPEIDHNALWDFVDSPIPATLTRSIDDQIFAMDSMPSLGLVCDGGKLRSVPPAGITHEQYIRRAGKR